MNLRIPTYSLATSDLLQVLSILTMERPVSFSSEDIRDEKVSRSAIFSFPCL